MALSRLPSVDRLLSSDLCARLIPLYGRRQVTDTVRRVLERIRQDTRRNGAALPDEQSILTNVGDTLARDNESSLREVINLTGTLLHTNLGRSPLPQEAIDSMVRVAMSPSNLEFDIESGARGDRDAHTEHLLAEITGAEAATVVNNNAAAVLLALNTLALDKEVPVSRGELVEIGGSFRIPEIMARAGCRLVEVGATNRTHPRDYERAMGPSTALVMKVHTSNYAIQGFTTAVDETTLAALAHDHGLPFITDLGSGTLIDLTRYGLPPEATVQSALDSGADLVTFSGDKLLGGPQAGIVVGKREFIDRLKANPMKRALRVDKITIAALFEVLKLYRDPDTLPERLPALRLLTRPADSILACANQLLPTFAKRLAGAATVAVAPCHSQIGSGSLPLDLLPGFALVITPTPRDEASLQRLARAFRRLPVPVLGRIHDGSLWFDLRALENPAELSQQLPELELS